MMKLKREDNTRRVVAREGRRDGKLANDFFEVK
jgi:hypothetical protein